MDELDNRLLIELQKDSRQSNKKLAKLLGVTEPRVKRRIEHLVLSEGYVFTALPDIKRMGYLTSAYFGIGIDRPSKFSEIAQKLCSNQSIRIISKCEGFADFIIGADFKSNEKLADFIAGYLGKINGITNIDTMVELKLIKNRTFGRLGLKNINQYNLTSPQINVNEIDHRLILELQKDSRVPVKKLAKLLDLSEPTVSRHIKNLMDCGVIELTAIRQSSNPTHGMFLIKVESSKMESVAESIARYAEVSFVGIYSGPVQIIIGLQSSSYGELCNFASQELIKIDGIQRVDRVIHLQILKQRFAWIR